VVDLHTHSTASDGALAPAALAEAAAAAGLAAFALTDHDTVAGLDEARRAAARHGVRLVPGVELSARWAGSTVHVLGLGIDPAAPALAAGLAHLAAARRARGARIAEKLTRLGHGAALAHAERAAGSTELGRSHFASGLVASGACRDAGEAFARYLGRGRKAYVAGEWLTLAECCALVRDAGGLGSLAHPSRYGLSSGALRRLVAEFAAAGGAALEVATGWTDPQRLATLAGHARRAGLAGTAGSDFHAPGARWSALGSATPLPTDLPSLAEARSWH
jgi:hypothetical protein